MARYIFQGNARDGMGRVLAGATITVFKAGTTTPAIIYPDQTSAAVSSILTADDGSFAFWASTDDDLCNFKIVVALGGFITKTYDNVVIFPSDISYVVAAEAARDEAVAAKNSAQADAAQTALDVISTQADAAAAAAAAAKLTGTSTSSNSISVASKNFTTQSGKQFSAGVWVLIFSDADPTNYMHGQVTSYVGTSLVVNVTNVGGSGTHTDWTITISGTRGAVGATGATGATGPQGPEGPAGPGSGDMLKSEDLSGLANYSNARTNLGLKGAAILDVGVIAGTVCAGDDSRLSNSRKCNNTFDSAGASRTALGLGSAAVLDVGTTANKVVQLDSSGKLPAVDGSQLTNLSTNKLARWTTAGRPTPGSTDSYFGYNTTLGYPEYYDTGTSAWVPMPNFPDYTIDWLLIGGGGAGGCKQSAYNGQGGGGGGGYKEGTGLSVHPGNAMQIVIGAGGSGTLGVASTDGASSTFNGQTALGGGAGACAAGSAYIAARSGASGGGASNSGTGASGTTGQGNKGGDDGSGNRYSSGGGGGAGAAGGNSSGSSAGVGGDGIARSISGSSLYYCPGGGGGAYYSGEQAAGGNGIGGAGGTPGGNGTANRGAGGGGGGSGSGEAAGGNGGSGVCIIKYPGAQRGVGGTVTSSGGYTIHTFTESGIFYP